MNRPVFIGAHALISAAGETPGEIARHVALGIPSPGTLSLGTRQFPYFGLKLAGTWLARAEAACRKLAAQLPRNPGKMPLFVASSSFQIGHFETAAGEPDLPPACASFSRQLADWLEMDGPVFSFSNACISGFSALDAARSLISAGHIDDALVVGVELENRSTVAGFAAMELLSPTTCRPLDADRDGLVLGEALAAVRLQAVPSPWRIDSLRCGLDAYSLTGPAPDGGPLADVIQETLDEAGCTGSAIDLIKLQAAGSPGSDLAEANALRRLFPAEMPALLSLKPTLGHTLGASGVAELSALLTVLDAGTIPPTPGFRTPDPAIGLHPAQPGAARVRTALLNLLGFGGGLACLLVTRTS